MFSTKYCEIETLELMFKKEKLNDTILSMAECGVQYLEEQKYNDIMNGLHQIYAEVERELENRENGTYLCLGEMA